MAEHKLAVVDVAAAAYRFVASRIGEIILIGIVPFALTALIGYYAADALTGWQLDVLDGQIAATGLAPKLLLTSLGVQLANAVLIAVAAVAYHRMVLFEERGRLTDTHSLMRFLLVIFLIGLILFIFGFAASILAAPLVMLGSELVVSLVPLGLIILAMWLGLRLAPAFPHIVATGRAEMAYAWD